MSGPEHPLGSARTSTTGHTPVSNQLDLDAAPGGVRGLFTRRFGGAHLSSVEVFEAILHYAVAVVLLGVAGYVLYHTVYDLFTTNENYATAATTAVNGVLFSIIILEVMRTVLAHFEHGGLQLQPFLIIGTISAVREILSVGAKLSLNGGSFTTAEVHLSLLELGVNAAVVVGLSFALVLVRRLAGLREDDDKPVGH